MQPETLFSTAKNYNNTGCLNFEYKSTDFDRSEFEKVDMGVLKGT